MPEVFHANAAQRGAGPFRTFLAFLGSAFLGAVAYMDPGNWATDIAGRLGMLTSPRRLSVLTCVIATVIIALNGKLLFDAATG